MIAKGSRSLSIKDISDYLSEEEILEFYTGISNLPITTNSPLREDRDPSFKIDYNENGNVRFYDFGGSNESGGLYDMLMSMYNLTFQEVLDMIHREMIYGKDIEKRDPLKRVFQRKESVRISNLQVKVRPWRDYDISFWEKYGINKYWLEFGDIHPISHMFIEKGDEKMVIPCDRQAYVYVEFKDGKPTFKIYQPFSERYKWINNHDKSVWDLWSKLPSSGETLIITSSRKDALCIWANLNIPSICLQAESAGPKEHVVLQLKARFKNIYVLYDNDFKSAKNWGRINGKKIADLFEFKQIEIPEIYRSKDPSDLYRDHGKTNFKNIINNLLNKK